MPVSIGQAQIDMLRYDLECLHDRAASYARTLESKDLSDEEQRILLDHHRKNAVQRTLTKIENALGGWALCRDPAERACP